MFPGWGQYGSSSFPLPGSTAPPPPPPSGEPNENQISKGKSDVPTKSEDDAQMKLLQQQAQSWQVQKQMQDQYMQQVAYQQQVAAYQAAWMQHAQQGQGQTSTETANFSSGGRESSKTNTRKPFVNTGNPNTDFNKGFSQFQNKQCSDSTAKEPSADEEFDKQLTEWNSQFENWKQRNQNHPDQGAFKAYEQQWLQWREQLTQRHEQMKKLRGVSGRTNPAPPIDTNKVQDSDNQQRQPYQTTKQRNDDDRGEFDRHNNFNQSAQRGGFRPNNRRGLGFQGRGGFDRNEDHFGRNNSNDLRGNEKDNGFRSENLEQDAKNLPSLFSVMIEKNPQLKPDSLSETNDGDFTADSFVQWGEPVIDPAVKLSALEQSKAGNIKPGFDAIRERSLSGDSRKSSDKQFAAGRGRGWMDPVGFGGPSRGQPRGRGNVVFNPQMRGRGRGADQGRGRGMDYGRGRGDRGRGMARGGRGRGNRDSFDQSEGNANEVPLGWGAQIAQMTKQHFVGATVVEEAPAQAPKPVTNPYSYYSSTYLEKKESVIGTWETVEKEPEGTAKKKRKKRRRKKGDKEEGGEVDEDGGDKNDAKEGDSGAKSVEEVKTNANEGKETMIETKSVIVENGQKEAEPESVKATTWAIGPLLAKCAEMLENENSNPPTDLKSNDGSVGALTAQGLTPMDMALSLSKSAKRRKMRQQKAARENAVAESTALAASLAATQAREAAALAARTQADAQTAPATLKNQPNNRQKNVFVWNRPPPKELPAEQAAATLFEHVNKSVTFTRRSNTDTRLKHEDFVMIDYGHKTLLVNGQIFDQGKMKSFDYSHGGDKRPTDEAPRDFNNDGLDNRENLENRVVIDYSANNTAPEPPRPSKPRIYDDWENDDDDGPTDNRPKRRNPSPSPERQNRQPQRNFRRKLDSPEPYNVPQQYRNFAGRSRSRSQSNERVKNWVNATTTRPPSLDERESRTSAVDSIPLGRSPGDRSRKSRSIEYVVRSRSRDRGRRSDSRSRGRRRSRSVDKRGRATFQRNVYRPYKPPRSKSSSRSRSRSNSRAGAPGRYNRFKRSRSRDKRSRNRRARSSSSRGSSKGRFQTTRSPIRRSPPEAVLNCEGVFKEPVRIKAELEAISDDDNSDKLDKISNRSVSPISFLKKLDPSIAAIKAEDAPSETLMSINDLLLPPGREKRPDHIAIIMRGLPGSGKSYISKLIKDKEAENGGGAPRILSLDDYFMVEVENMEIDADSGKRVKVKKMEYEFEGEMEKSYRASLVKSFKKTIDDALYPFVIVDDVNDKMKPVEEMACHACLRGFQVYIMEMNHDVEASHTRNIHRRTYGDIQKIAKFWEPTPNTFMKLDFRPILCAPIEEVEMEVIDALALHGYEVSSVVDPASDDIRIKAELDDSQPMNDEQVQTNDCSDQVENDQSACEGPEQDFNDNENPAISKWERMELANEEKLDKLDGITFKKKNQNDHPETMEEYMQLPDDYQSRKSEPGKKRVRWADIEEKSYLDRQRDMGFVVGQTDWKKLMDPDQPAKALTRTKFI